MSEYIVKLDNINKAFSGVKALDDVSFNLRSGEVMALLGENGAGKSTLMKILSGVYTPDSGKITIGGRTFSALDPRRAQELGVSMIHQELNMCTQLSIAENIFLGRELTKNGVLANHEMNELSRQVLSRLNVTIEPETVVGNISVSKQQLVEIAKALSVNARILIMDEPTSALTTKEIDDLFEIIHKLRSEGHAIIYISHRLEELKHIVDRLTIMRDGRFIKTMDYADTNIDEIVSHMVGREIKEKFPHIECQKGKKLFEVRNLNAGKLVRNINLSVYEGEILGIAGLMGAGRTEMTRTIFGVDPKESGEIFLDDHIIPISGPADAIRAGIVLAPEDRKRDGLCTGLSIRENIGLPNLDWLSNDLGIVKKTEEKATVAKTVESFAIKLSSPEMNAGNLSGGNQQKVVIGKWLARTSRIVIFDEPTRGIDVAAKVEIYHLMNALKKNGIGVMFVSSEMPELLGMADRILVVCEGRITGELDAKGATQNKILELAVAFDRRQDQSAA